jgi:hypothetical protein
MKLSKSLLPYPITGQHMSENSIIYVHRTACIEASLPLVTHVLCVPTYKSNGYTVSPAKPLPKTDLLPLKQHIF